MTFKFHKILQIANNHSGHSYKFFFMNILSKYFNWLQKDVPAGEVERYPRIDANGETIVKGIFVTGDLTGIPLLKLAAE